MSDGPRCSKGTRLCPFYQFSAPFGQSQVMRAVEGNQCGACTEMYAPCQMDMSGEEPDWKNCPINYTQGEAILQVVMGRVVVFPNPKELEPGAAQSMPFSDWYGEVMGEKV